MKQQEKLAMVKDAIDAMGAYAVLDRAELAGMGLMVDFTTGDPTVFTNKSGLSSFIKRDEAYFLTVNYKDEVQIHPTKDVPAEEAKSNDAAAEARKQQLKEDNEKKRIRRTKVMEIINTASLPKADVEEFFDQILIHHMAQQNAAFICTMLGIQKSELPMLPYSTADAPAYDYKTAVLTALRAGGKKATRTRLAVILSHWEQYAMASVSDQYAAVLEQFGYKLNRKGELVPIETKEKTDGVTD